MRKSRCDRPGESSRPAAVTGPKCLTHHERTKRPRRCVTRRGWKEGCLRGFRNTLIWKITQGVLKRTPCPGGQNERRAERANRIHRRARDRAAEHRVEADRATDRDGRRLADRA